MTHLMFSRCRETKSIAFHHQYAFSEENIKKSGESTKFTLPETNIAIAPENSPSQKDIASSNHQFSGAMLVSGSVR